MTAQSPTGQQCIYIYIYIHFHTSFASVCIFEEFSLKTLMDAIQKLLAGDGQ